MSGASLRPAAVRACLGVMLGMHRVDGSDGSGLETLFVVYTASSVICILCCLFTILCFLCIRPLRPDYVNRVVFIISVIECLYGMAQLLPVFMFQLCPVAVCRHLVYSGPGRARPGEEKPPAERALAPARVVARRGRSGSRTG